MFALRVLVKDEGGLAGVSVCRCPSGLATCLWCPRCACSRLWVGCRGWDSKPSGGTLCVTHMLPWGSASDARAVLGSLAWHWESFLGPLWHFQWRMSSGGQYSHFISQPCPVLSIVPFNTQSLSPYFPCSCPCP